MNQFENERKSKIYGVPIIPPLPDSIKKQPLDPNPVVAICGECGREVHHIDNYCCTHPFCPMKPLITS